MIRPRECTVFIYPRDLGRLPHVMLYKYNTENAHIVDIYIYIVTKSVYKKHTSIESKSPILATTSKSYLFADTRRFSIRDSP